ncbi:MAG TPA: cobyrinate a,c-diamide synthase [Streptosporangiaceae bacterium]|nr:cobyrinate a,c-diamide synthase [Streptosporangiaceae bacterium]
MVALPRLVIAAPASGCGKTTVACGLMAALRARGLAVSGHKVGPDYIDPGYHALATGRPPRNLDPFLCGEDLIAPLFRHGASGAQVAVIEGVMGLFDGVADPALGLNPDFGSTAHVARLLGAPVVLVVDAARAGRSVAALAAGFAGFDPRTPVAGVILNRVASDRHERLLRDALAGTGLPVYGAIRRAEGIITPSRHLGLVPAAERAATASPAIDRMGALVAAQCDLDALLALARDVPALPGPAWAPPGPAEPAIPAIPAPVVAVAAGAAFTFGYTEQAELLAAAGARVAPFDPLRDEDLPGQTAGLILGGGFPEVHAAGLSANRRLREQVAALATRGAPVAAECAGLLYLARTLDDLPMCGVLDVRAAMTPKLTLGYRQAVAMTDSVLARAGDELRGHEFHRTAAVPAAGDQPAWQLGPGTVEGHVAGSVVASYLHTHWAGHPAAAARFTAACAKVPAS